MFWQTIHGAKKGGQILILHVGQVDSQADLGSWAPPSSVCKWGEKDAHHRCYKKLKYYQFFESIFRKCFLFVLCFFLHFGILLPVFLLKKQKKKKCKRHIAGYGPIFSVVCIMVRMIFSY